MHILCATDFSAPAAEAADVAAALARALRLPLRLVHSAPEWPYFAEPMLVEDDGMLEAWRKPLEAEAARLRSTGVDVTSELRRGEACHELIADTAEHPARLIVMGVAGAGFAERWLVGRVAERLAESSPVPVLVVRKPAPLLSWLKGDNALKVLCGVDFNLSSDAALMAVKELKGIGRLDVEAVHLREEKRAPFIRAVTGTPPSGEAQTSDEVTVGRDVWDRVNEVLGEPPATVHVPVTSQHADHGMVHLADELAASLIVVGTHQRHGWQRLTHHSFSRGVLAHAATNVLCVPSTASPPPYHIPRIHRVLVATDLVTPAHPLLRFALTLLKEGGELRLLHVIPSPEAGVNPLLRSVVYLGNSMAAAKAQAEAQSALDLLVAGLPVVRHLKVTAEALLHEDPAGGISAEVQRFGADLICMGTRGQSRTAAAVRGSVVQAVTAAAPVPVLIIPPPVL